jgi:hypothetical protein
MTKKKIPPLIIEHFTDTSNLCFISLIEYKRDHYFGIIDNITDTELNAFILSHAKPEIIDIDTFIKFAIRWFYKSSGKYPLSFEFAKHGLTTRVQPLIKTFDLSYVSRVVGKPFIFEDLNTTTRIKRRRVQELPEYVEITFKKKKDEATS